MFAGRRKKEGKRFLVKNLVISRPFVFEIRVHANVIGLAEQWRIGEMSVSEVGVKMMGGWDECFETTV